MPLLRMRGRRWRRRRIGGRRFRGNGFFRERWRRWRRYLRDELRRWRRVRLTRRRRGDERNYQKVLDRLQPFKDKVDLHKRNIEALRREISGLR